MSLDQDKSCEVALRVLQWAGTKTKHDLKNVVWKSKGPWTVMLDTKQVDVIEPGFFVQVRVMVELRELP